MSIQERVVVFYNKHLFGQKLTKRLNISQLMKNYTDCIILSVILRINNDALVWLFYYL